MRASTGSPPRCGTRGIGKGERVLVQSRNSNAHVREPVGLLQARRGLGADQLPPDAARGRLSGRHLPRPRHAARPRLRRPCRRGARSRAVVRARAGGRRRAPGRDRLRIGAGRSRAAAARPRGRGRVRRSLLVLLHLRHDRPAQGGGADAWPDGLRGHQPPRRPVPGHDRARLHRSWWRRCRMAPASISSCRSRAAPAPCCCRRSGSTRKRRGGWWRSTASRTCSPCRPSSRRWSSIRRWSGTTTPRSATSSTPARRCTAPTRSWRWRGSAGASCSTSASAR